MASSKKTPSARRAATPTSRKWVGAHVSTTGGVENAPLNAAAIGARTFALFVKNQRQWSAPPLTGEQAEAFRRNCEAHGFDLDKVLPHDGYLINLGNPDPAGLSRSREAFLDEMRRCELLGLKLLNFHPGSHLKQMAPADCLERIAESVNLALQRTRGVSAVFECTAGQGGYMGSTFEEIAALLDRVEDRSRTGVCLDTCHLFAAGYDLRSPEAFDAVMKEFDRTVGLSNLCGWHLNDCKGKLGSHLDRHAPIGDGELGLEPFRFIMRDPRFDGIPLILETPEPDRWEREIDLLYSLEGDSGPGDSG
ncbi:MAG: deoxyribonuclease IV [Acidobacteriota bacterium]